MHFLHMLMEIQTHQQNILHTNWGQSNHCASLKLSPTYCSN